VNTDVVSRSKTTVGASGLGASWLEILKEPGSTVDVDIWTDSVDIGKSVDVEVKTTTMIRMDFRTRETHRREAVKKMAESGAMGPANAEAAPTVESSTRKRHFV